MPLHLLMPSPYLSESSSQYNNGYLVLPGPSVLAELPSTSTQLILGAPSRSPEGFGLAKGSVLLIGGFRAPY